MTNVDADGHMFEPDEIYLAHCDPDKRELIPIHPSYGLLEAATPLGGYRGTKPTRPTECLEANPDNSSDPNARLRDMDREGIDQMVCFPSVVTSLSTYPIAVEAAMVRAYNRWMFTFCAAAPTRLFAPIVLPLQDIRLATAELLFWANESCFVGVTLPSRIPGRNLDDPFFDPIWRDAEEHDLPILIHSGTARPPYPIGTFEQSDNFFLMHLMHHPTEQMLALSALIGGGVLDRFQRIRFGFFEAGCGWVPWYMQRISEHARRLGSFVPLLRTEPYEYLKDGRCFFSCDPGEVSIGHFVQAIGPTSLVYASDYPHWDSEFPSSIAEIKSRSDISDDVKVKILGENARRLYTRLS